MGSAIGLWARSDWRQRRASLVALTLLIGIAFGVVSTVVAGARRTASSFDRLRKETWSYDHGIVIDAPGAGRYDDATVRRIVNLPQIEKSGGLVTYVASLPRADWEFALSAAEDATLGHSIERARLLRGRLPDANRADEVAISELAVGPAHADLGDVLHLRTLSPVQRLQLIAGDKHAFDHGYLGPDLRLRIVGVFRGVSDVVGRSNLTLFASPAFDRTYRGRVAYSSRILLVRRAAGTTARAFHVAVDRLTARGTLGVFDAETEDKPARQTIRTLSVGLVVFALVAAFASMLAVGQAIARHAAGVDAEQSVLATLGLTRAQRVWGLVATIAPAAAFGALIAVVGSVAASALMPVGLARRVEPFPGVRFDPLVAGATAVTVIVVVVGSALIAGLRMTRGRQARRRVPRARLRPTLSARAGPVVTTGTRLAFDRRPPAPPVRSALVATSSAVVVLVAALTFSASLDRLAGQPRRWGFGWDLMLDTSDTSVKQLAHELAANRDLDGVSMLFSQFTFARGNNGTEGIRAYGLDHVHGAVGFALRSGVQPVGPDEVVIGSVTARDRHLRVGDTISVAVCPCSGGAAKTSLGRVRVVGTALFPEDDDGNFTDALGFSGSGFERHVGESDGTRMAVNIAPGRKLSPVAAVLARRYPGQLSKYSYPSRPGEVENVIGLRRFPRALAGFTALLGLAALANVLFTTLRRRRRELATLRSLGFTPGQVTRCIIWQGLSVTAVGLAIGIPLGIVIGARVWLATTYGIGVATDASSPLVAIGVCALVALAVTIAVSAPAGWRAGRIQPAAALRSE